MSIKDPKALRVFVAMPGTDLGPRAKWRRPEDVRSFYQKVAQALEVRLERPVRLVVEREKDAAGVIYDSMFREALEAEVFLADLTGNNPNVIFELGVRYALRRNVTIPVSQETEGLPFNVAHLRAVQYAHQPDDMSVRQLVDLIAGGLESGHNDSPIMAALDLAVVPRGLWETVSGERRDQLLSAAMKAPNADVRLQLLRGAVESDKHSLKARLALLIELRKRGAHEEALAIADQGIELDPSRADLFKERGLNLARLERHEEATRALKDGVALEPKNKDLLATLGGALRREALLRSQYDQRKLRESLQHYEAALALDRHDTYPALNSVRLLLLLSRFELSCRRKAIERLRKLQHLCAFEAVDAPQDYWRIFDLADVELLLARAHAGLRSYERGVALVPEEHRRSVLASPLSSLRELERAGVLQGKQRQGFGQAIELLEGVIAREQRS
jgi:tetratricopeptide (TPR) repeat protein